MRFGLWHVTRTNVLELGGITREAESFVLLKTLKVYGDEAEGKGEVLRKTKLTLFLRSVILVLCMGEF